MFSVLKSLLRRAKKHWFRFTILIPIFYLCDLIISPVQIYLAPLHLTFQSGAGILLVLLLTVPWLSSRSWNNAMCNGSWFQLLYHVMPFQAVLFLIFADHHFLIAAVLAIALTVLLLLLSIALNNHQKRRPRTRREQWVEDTIRRRLSVLLTFAVLLIPSGIAWFQYDMQSVQYWADQSSLSAPDGDSDSEAAWPESAAPLLRSFEEERWKSLSIRERTDALQRLSTLEATRLGVDPPTVTVLKLSPFILGSHKMTVNLIQLDLQHVTEDPAENVLYTCLHETFHSFQDYVIQNTDWDSPLAASAYFEKARAWKANSEFYVSSNLNYDAYLTQPLEEDANAFAKEETALLLSVLSDQS